MVDIEVEVRAVEPLRVATITRTAPGFGPDSIGPVVGPIFPEVAGSLSGAGLGDRDFGPAIGIYTVDDLGAQTAAEVTSVQVKAGFVLAESVDTSRSLNGVEVSTLPEIDEAAVTVHHGTLDHIGDAWDALLAWIHDNGYEMAGPSREVYLSPPGVPQSEWETQLVQPVRRAASG